MFDVTFPRVTTAVTDETCWPLIPTVYETEVTAFWQVEDVAFQNAEVRAEYPQDDSEHAVTGIMPELEPGFAEMVRSVANLSNVSKASQSVASDVTLLQQAVSGTSVMNRTGFPSAHPPEPSGTGIEKNPFGVVESFPSVDAGIQSPT